MLLGFLSPIMVIARKYCQSDSLLNLYLSMRFGFREHYCPIPSEGNVCTEHCQYLKTHLASYSSLKFISLHMIAQPVTHRRHSQNADRWYLRNFWRLTIIVIPRARNIRNHFRKFSLVSDLNFCLLRKC